MIAPGVVSVGVERIRLYFGTDRPTTAAFERALAEAGAGLEQPVAERGPTLLDEQTPRWTGRYVLLCDGAGADEPSHVGVFGSSGD
ncbi:hypothetical protein ACWERV_26625 [Streptomyces sp. NPDC004031]